jgi:hypothetical protein
MEEAMRTMRGAARRGIRAVSMRLNKVWRRGNGLELKKTKLERNSHALRPVE